MVGAAARLWQQPNGSIIWISIYEYMAIPCDALALEVEIFEWTICAGCGMLGDESKEFRIRFSSFRNIFIGAPVHFHKSSPFSRIKIDIHGLMISFL